MSLIIDIFNGLLTGTVSGLLVSFYWKKRMDKMDAITEDKKDEHEHTRQFKEEIQLLCRYLDRMQLELELPEDEETKSKNIRRLIDARPGTPSFVGGMTSSGISIMTRLNSLLIQIDTAAKTHMIKEKECENFRRDLFLIVCDLLKNTSLIQKKWVDYKKQ